MSILHDSNHEYQFYCHKNLVFFKINFILFHVKSFNKLASLVCYFQLKFYSKYQKYHTFLWTIQKNIDFAWFFITEILTKGKLFLQLRGSPVNRWVHLPEQTLGLGLNIGCMWSAGERIKWGQLLTEKKRNFDCHHAISNRQWNWFESRNNILG